MTAPERLQEYRELVDRRLDVLLPSIDQAPKELHAAMRYSCLSPGKRLRPALCMASAEAVGGDAERALDAACAVEMVHGFSLIHDDLPAIDNDALRRGAPTCHVEFGEALALLAGDALFALAFEVLANAEGEAARVLEVVQLLARASGSDGLVGGEVVDVLSEGRAVTEEAVEFIHSRKTGALISASCTIGALLGGATPEQVQEIRDFGERIGLAFQVTDDLLNELSTAEQLGKAAGSDRERNKATYPALLGIEGARRAAACYREEALAALQTTKHPLLQELANYAVDRPH